VDELLKAAAKFVAWYALEGAVVLAIASVPGVIVHADSGRPYRLSRKEMAWIFGLWWLWLILMTVRYFRGRA
jgi:hypothetical protein